MIDDDNISTKIPKATPPGSTINIEAVTYLVKHAQISARISSRIMSVKAFKQSPTEAARTVDEIHDQLMDLLNCLPTHLRVPYSPKREFPPMPQRIGTLYLHCGIYGSLLATHMIFFYPWMSACFGRDPDPRFRNQIRSSAEVIAHAARQIILVLRSVVSDVAAPAWLCFYYSMYAHINLFVHTLKYPQKATALSDLALLDICAGHFAHVEHITSSTIAFHFPRDSAALAARIVRATRSKDTGDVARYNTPHPATIGLETGGDNCPDGPFNALDESLLHFSYDRTEVRSCPSKRAVLIPHSSLQNDLYDYMNFDMEAWNILPGYDDATSFDDFLA